MRFSAATRSLANLPFYLEKTSFKHVEGAPGPFQDAHNTQDNMFPWLIKDPPMMGNFNAFMTGQRADRKQCYPDAPGKLILQDLPPVIDTIQDLTPKIERQK
ncbi:hypothetical protein EV127DRAFT_484391 [Xylaria flabelliformis]|nr:hypothetical protein EV127DRAFT_484391 [Xylaria flabelliformis]